jgi:hypothetical protein
VSVNGYDFIPRARAASPVHRDVTYELEQYPEDKTELAWKSTSRRRFAST